MITTFTGPMHSSKTASLIVAYNKIWNKEHVKVFKARQDTRDPGVLKSKDFEETVPAIEIDKLEEILDHIDEATRVIFVDEIQWLEGNIDVLNYLSIVRDMDIYAAGLNQTSEQKPFGVMPYILAISDSVVNIKASCYDCGRDAALTYYEGKDKTGDTLVGDAGYLPLCPACLKRREGEENLTLRFLKKDNQE